MNKIRVRFGIKLSWPITNAGTLVLRNVREDHFMTLLTLTEQIKSHLTMIGRDDIAQRLVCEAS